MFLFFLVFPLVGFHQFGLVCILCFQVSLVAFGLISWFAWRGSCRLCTELLALFRHLNSGILVCGHFTNFLMSDKNLECGRARFVHSLCLDLCLF